MQVPKPKRAEEVSTQGGYSGNEASVQQNETGPISINGLDFSLLVVSALNKKKEKIIVNLVVFPFAILYT